MMSLKDLWNKVHVDDDVAEGFGPLYVVVDTEADHWEGTQAVLRQGQGYGMYKTYADAEAVRSGYKDKESFKIFMILVEEIKDESSSDSEQKVG